jgi:hypothetical protein
MRKNLGRALICLSLILLPSTLFAAGIIENNSFASIKDFIIYIKNFLLGIVGALSLFFIIWGGVKYIASRGNPKQIEAAKKTLTYAVIGIIFVLLSQIILTIITGDFMSKTFGNNEVERSDF